MTRKKHKDKTSIDSPVHKEGGRRYNLYNTIGVAAEWEGKKKGAYKRRINLCSDVKVYKDGKLIRTESKWKGKGRSG